MTLNAKRLQQRLGVTADGDIGRGTLAALFVKMGCPPARAVELAIGANVALPRAGILETSLRLAHFLAQLAHESGGFRYMEEIASGSAYEGRGDLGNTYPGDGKRFKGRGPIQCTGRANYRRFGIILGIDIETHPDIAAVPSIGMQLACAYWTDRNLNAKADADDLIGITRAINGGTNGLDDRRQRLGQAKGIVL